MLTYGSIVRQLMTDLEDMEEVNKQLDSMCGSPGLHSEARPLPFSRSSHVACLCRGYNIGIRLIDEFLAKSKTTRCGDFRETADRVAKASPGAASQAGHT